MFTRLLVCLDGSPRADAALEQAVVLGERFHSTVLVAHVRVPPALDADFRDYRVMTSLRLRFTPTACMRTK